MTGRTDADQRVEKLQAEIEMLKQAYVADLSTRRQAMAQALADVDAELDLLRAKQADELRRLYLASAVINGKLELATAIRANNLEAAKPVALRNGAERPSYEVRQAKLAELVADKITTAEHAALVLNWTPNVKQLEQMRRIGEEEGERASQLRPACQTLVQALKIEEAAQEAPASKRLRKKHLPRSGRGLGSGKRN